jgi:dipeptidase E
MQRHLTPFRVASERVHKSQFVCNVKHCSRWHAVGLTPLLTAAAARGAVLTGGSAGAICWFDGGHSDSGDKESFKEQMIAAAAATTTATTTTTTKTTTEETGGDSGGDEASAAPLTAADAKEWQYIRVPALGLFPGL